MTTYEKFISNLDPALREAAEERSAILEFDANLTRSKAEETVLRMYRTTTGQKPLSAALHQAREVLQT